MALCVCVLLGSGCASQAAGPVAPKSADFDRPVPAAEPRADAGYQIDLEPTAECEQAFDLQLYRDRRVELIRWDDRDGCHQRDIDVRYLSAALQEPELFELIRKLVRAVKRRPDGESRSNGESRTNGQSQTHGDSRSNGDSQPNR